MSAEYIPKASKTSEVEEVVKNDNETDEKVAIEKDPYDIMVELAAAYGEESNNKATHH